MSTMIERVARALQKADGEKPSPCAGACTYSNDWRDYIDDAVTAIAAMREPTKEMVEAGDDTAGTMAITHDYSALAPCWQPSSALTRSSTMHLDEKVLEVVAAALEPKCRSFTGGANQLAKAVARELAEAALQALSPGSTGEAVGLKLGSRLTVDGVEAVVVPVEPNSAQLDRALAAEAALAAERERCAKVAEDTKSYDDNLQRSAGCATTGQRIAAAIRAQGE